MAYERVNWEDTPSAETPLSAENLNTMDEKIADLDAQAEELLERHNQLEDSVELLDQRMDTFVSLPAGTTAGNAELIEARTINDQAYNTLHNALDGEFASIKTRATNLETEVTDARTITAHGHHTTITFGSVGEGLRFLGDSLLTVLDHITEPYSASKTYSIGDTCHYQYAIYKCIQGGRAKNPGSSPAYWEQIVVYDDLLSLFQTGLNGLQTQVNSAQTQINSIQTALSNKITIDGTKMVIHA